MDNFDGIEEYLTQVVSEALENIENKCNCQDIAAKFPEEYSISYCAEEFTRDMEDSRNNAVDAVVQYLLDQLFYNY